MFTRLQAGTKYITKRGREFMIIGVWRGKDHVAVSYEVVDLKTRKLWTIKSEILKKALEEKDIEVLDVLPPSELLVSLEILASSLKKQE